MGIDIRCLSSLAQKQVLAKLRAQEHEKAEKMLAASVSQETADGSTKESKYHNIKVSVGGIVFDSKKEARRFTELAALLNAGEISDLRLQHNITLIEGFTTPDGKRIKPEIYKADFSYLDKNGNRVYEDAKGKRTQTYINKRKQVADKFGITIMEV